VNLASSDISEALDYFETKMKAVDEDQSALQAKFQSRFSDSFVSLGRSIAG
jgi:hypothetical protein